MTLKLHSLLRRTLMGIAALAAVISIPAEAQITKAEGGTLCTSFSNISITPSGGISVTGCAGSTGGGGTSGAFSISGTGTLALNSVSPSSFTISRTGGTTGAVTVTFDRGGGCGPAPLTGDTVAFTDGQASANVNVRTPNNDATCTVTLTGVTAGAGATAPTLGSPTMAYLFVGNGAGVPGGSTGGGGGSTAAGVFTIGSTGTLALNTQSTTTFAISRTGGTKGPVTVTFDRGGGCGPAPLTGDTIAFTDGQASANVTVRTPNNDATCTVTLKTAVAGSGSTATSAPSVGTPAMAYAFVGNGAGVPPGSTPTGGGGQFNCPATPGDANSGLTLHYGGGIEGFLFLKSGQIGYTALPAFSTYGGLPQSGSTNVAASITTGSPSSGTVELSINHCPGVIDTNNSYTQGTTGGKCYISFPVDQSVHTLPWFENVGPVRAATDALANAAGICEAFASNGPWYVNVRYTFPDAGNAHDMAWQLNWANFNP